MHTTQQRNYNIIVGILLIISGAVLLISSACSMISTFIDVAGYDALNFRYVLTYLLMNLPHCLSVIALIVTGIVFFIRKAEKGILVTSIVFNVFSLAIFIWCLISFFIEIKNIVYGSVIGLDVFYVIGRGIQNIFDYLFWGMLLTLIFSIVVAVKKSSAPIKKIWFLPGIASYIGLIGKIVGKVFQFISFKVSFLSIFLFIIDLIASFLFTAAMFVGWDWIAHREVPSPVSAAPQQRQITGYDGMTGEPIYGTVTGPDDNIQY